MSNPIKYSDLFQDDGALDLLIEKINSLKKEIKGLIGSAANELKQLKSEAKTIDIVNPDSVKQLAKVEQEIEKATESYGKYQKAEKEVNEIKKKATKTLTEQEKLIKKRNELLKEEAVKTAGLKVEIQEINKANKQQAKEALGLVGAYERQNRRLNELRNQYKDLVVEGKKNTKEAQDLLLAVTELDAELKDIDKSVGQTQRSVGDYRDAVRGAYEDTNKWGQSMVGAIDKSGALGDVTAKLQTIISLLSSAKDKLTKETVENTAATEVESAATTKAAVSQNIFRRAINKSKIAFRAFNKVIKASAIGLVIVALGSLAAVLTQTQAGLVKLRAVSLAASGVMGVITTRLIEVSDAFLALGKIALLPIRLVINGFKAIGTQAILLKEQIVNAFDFSDEAAISLSEAQKSADEAATDFKKTFTDVPNQVKEAFGGISTLFNGLSDDIGKVVDAASPLAEELFRIELATAKLSKQQAEQLAISERLEEIEGDATRSFEEREKAIRGSIAAQKEAADLALQQAENRKKVFELETAYNLQGKAETDAIKIERIEFEKEILEAKKEASIKALQLIRVQNQLEQDLLEKNLDILIDGFDNQKTINEQLIADEKRNFQERKRILEETQKLRQRALDNEVSEIQKKSKKEIDIQDLIATSDSVRLNEKIRLLGLSEILEGRLLEVIRDNRTAINDLAVAEKELNQSRIDFLREVITQTEDLNATLIETETERALQQEKLRKERLDKELELQLKLAEGDEELTRALIEKKKALEKESAEKIDDIKIGALQNYNSIAEKELEISLLERGATEKELTEELTDFKIDALQKEIALKKELQEDSLDDELELARLKAKKELDIEKENAKKKKELQDTIVMGTLDGLELVNQREQEIIDRNIEATKVQVTTQQKLAAEGLDNTLAFEEAQLAKLEQKKLEADRKAIRLEKIKALYSAYSAAAGSGDNQAVLKVLKDFAIIQGLESTLLSFGTGTGEHGTFEDAIEARGGSKGGNSIKRGIVRGEKHKTRGYGIPVLVEGDEGLLSGRQMSNLGKDNFVKLASALDKGVLGSDIFGGQINLVPKINTVNVDFRNMENKLDSVKKAILEKPVQQVNVESLSKSYTDFIDTTITGNKKLISRYRVNKKRL